MRRNARRKLVKALRKVDDETTAGRRFFCAYNKEGFNDPTNAKARRLPGFQPERSGLFKLNCQL